MSPSAPLAAILGVTTRPRRGPTSSGWIATTPSSTRSWRPSSPPGARAPTLPRRAAWSPAAARSRGARRAPAAPVQGTSRAPQWTGGGVVFGPSPRKYGGKVNPRRTPGASHRVLARTADAALAVLTVPSRRRPRRSGRGAATAADGGPPRWSCSSDEDVQARSFRNLERTHVVAVGRARGGRRGLGPRLLVAKAALDSAREARRRDERRAPSVLIAPVVARRASAWSRAHKYTFRVHPEAHKTQIRQAVEELFDVMVTDVNILTVQSKPKRRGGLGARRPGWKKAIVTAEPARTPDPSSSEGRRLMASANSSPHRPAAAS